MSKEDFFYRVENKLKNEKNTKIKGKKSLARRKKALAHKKMPLARQENVRFCAKIFRNCLKMKNFTESCKKTIFFVQKLHQRRCVPTAYSVFCARQRLMSTLSDFFQKYSTPKLALFIRSNNCRVK